nr:hypothetical protein [Actinomadura hibisca]
MNLRYDSSSVYWWLRGRCPEQPTPELLADIFSARFHRPVHLDELGFDQLAPSDSALLFPASVPTAIRTATRLWKSLQRPDGHRREPFVRTAVAEAGWRYAFDPDDATLDQRGGARVESAHVEAIRARGKEFGALDRRYGGGYSRTYLALFLSTEVAPLLRGTYTTDVGRDLFHTAADLTAQVAFAACDTGQQGAAQRAWIQALRLAKAAGDRSLGAHILANLATQAIYLELPGEAVRLARAAIDTAGRRPHPLVAARLLATEANARAMIGDLNAFNSCYGRARTALERADSTGAACPPWASYFTGAHLAGTGMRSLLDLDRPDLALTHGDQALHTPAANNRTRALHTALLATAHARAGNLDHAVHLGDQAIILAVVLRSRRVTGRLALLADALRPHHTAPMSPRSCNATTTSPDRPPNPVMCTRDLRPLRAARTVVRPNAGRARLGQRAGHQPPRPDPPGQTQLPPLLGLPRRHRRRRRTTAPVRRPRSSRRDRLEPHPPHPAGSGLGPSHRRPVPPHDELPIRRRHHHRPITDHPPTRRTRRVRLPHLGHRHHAFPQPHRIPAARRARRDHRTLYLPAT